MNVPSYEFIGFALISAVLYNYSYVSFSRQTLLLVTNLLFFANQMGSVQQAFPFVLFLCLGYGLMHLSQRKAGSGHIFFAGILCLVVVTFAWLKKYSFIPEQLLLPFSYKVIGLSYVLFRVLHLIIDSRSGQLPDVSPVNYINYTLNFTSLISGPIQRYEDYKNQTDSPQKLDAIIIGNAVERIAFGFFKVFILASLFQSLQSEASAVLATQSGQFTGIVSAILIAVCYPLFLYCNFSGYTDVVLGVGWFFGWQLPENFSNPFLSENFIIFYNRWHISLSSWLKTYVYNMLLLSWMEKFPSRKIEPYLGVAAFFVTFFLVGVWHGQTTEFLFFGLLQGGGVAVNKLYQLQMVQLLGKKNYKQLSGHTLYVALCRGMTFSWFAFSLFWFWSSWSKIAEYYRPFGYSAVLLWVVIILSASLGIEMIRRCVSFLFGLKIRGHSFVRSRYVRTVIVTVLVIITTSVILLSNAPAPDIVYKSF